MTAVDQWLETNGHLLVSCDVRGTRMTEHACASRWVQAGRTEAGGRRSPDRARLSTQGLECLGCPSGCRRAQELELVDAGAAALLMDTPNPMLRVLVSEPRTPAPPRAPPSPPEPDIVCVACRRTETRRKARSLRYPDFENYCRVCMRWASRCIQVGNHTDNAETRQQFLALIPDLWIGKTCRRCPRKTLVWTPVGDPLCGYCKTCMTHARVRVGKGRTRQALAEWLESN